MVNELRELLVNTAVRAATTAVVEATTEFGGNYLKRRKVGFSVIPSIKGSYKETRSYFDAKVSGSTYSPDVPAITFDK